MTLEKNNSISIFRRRGDASRKFLQFLRCLFTLNFLSKSKKSLIYKKINFEVTKYQIYVLQLNIHQLNILLIYLSTFIAILIIMNYLFHLTEFHILKSAAKYLFSVISFVNKKKSQPKKIPK